MSETSDDDLLYLNEAKIATVVWLQYDGDREDLEDNYLLMERDKDLGSGLAALGGKVEQHDREQAREEHGTDDIDLDQVAEHNAYREAKEEAQIESLYDIDEIGRVYTVSRPGGTYDEPWIIYHFIAKTDDEPASMQHREGDLQWHHEDDLDENDYAFRQGAFISHIRDQAPFTALVDDIQDDGYIDGESTIHTVDELLDWPDEDYLEQNLIEAPETVRDHYLGQEE